MSKIPDGRAVEVLAITMAAARGWVWQRLSIEEARDMRVMANAALMRLGADAHEVGLLRLKDRLTTTVATMRQGAEAIEPISAEIAKALYRDAMTVETMLQILSGADEEEAV